jgi:signal transduction histidine kinase
MHGGTIDVDTQIGRGSKFSAWLPVWSEARAGKA